MPLPAITVGSIFEKIAGPGAEQMTLKQADQTLKAAKVGMVQRGAAAVALRSVFEHGTLTRERLAALVNEKLPAQSDEELITRARGLFDEMDREGTGNITEDDIVAAVRRTKASGAAKDIAKVVMHLTGTNEISRDAFETFVADARAALGREV